MSQAFTRWRHLSTHPIVFWYEGQNLARLEYLWDQVGLYLAGIHQMAPLEHTSDKQACYSFIDPGRMKG